MKNKFSKKYKNVLIIKGTQGMAKLSLAVVSGSRAVRRSAGELFVCASETISTSSFVGGRLGLNPRARRSDRAGRQLTLKNSSKAEAIASLNPRARRSGLLWAQLGVALIAIVTPVLAAFAPNNVASRLPLAPEKVSAATSNQLNFQGRLLTASGALVPDGVYNMEFDLYNVSSGGSSLWTEDRLVTNTQGVSVQNGYYSVYLGEYDAFPAIDWSQDLYLGMTIRGTSSCAWGSCTPADSEMTPRFKLTAVPYAFRASNVASSSTNAASTNSDGVSITTGNALGATSNSGNITVDVGTATGTAGTISLGSSNASALTIGRAGVTTTLQGSVSLTGAGTALNVTNNATIGGVLQVNGNTTLGDTPGSDTLTVNAAATFNGSLNVATGNAFTNAGSSVFTAISISDVSGGGNIGTAASTVDVATTFNVNQTTSGQTLTLPTPTTTTAGRIAFVNNVGSTSFTMYGNPIASGKSASFIWNGTSWVQTISFTSTGVDTLAAIGSTPNANGASISGTTLTLQPADGTFGGVVSATTQTFAGAKTFSAAITASAGITVSANQTINLTGGATGSRPGSPSEGMLFYDTTTKQLLVYSNGKWQSDRSPATKIVAASNSSQAAKDGADYVGDGNTGTANDGDQVEINSAITAVNALGGGTVYLAEGTYTIDATINMSPKVTLVGAGDATLITIPNSLLATNTIVTIIDINSDTDAAVKNLRIDGNKAGQSTGEVDAITVNSQARVEGVHVTNAYGYGITGTASSVAVDNVFVENSTFSGLYANFSSSTITGSRFINNTQNGVQINGINTTISGNYFEGNGSSSSYANVNINAAKVTVTGNTIKTGSVGIMNFGNDNSTITGNTISSPTGDGINIALSFNHTITGNTIRSAGAEGIELATSSYSLISSNNVDSSTSYGILLVGTQDIVSNNTVSAGATSGIYVKSGDSHTVSGNNLYNNTGSGSTSSIDLDNGFAPTNTRIIGNTIRDTAGTGYAINIAGSSITGTYLADNNYSGTGAATINDAGTNTRFASQISAASVLQSSSSVITANANSILTGSIDPTASASVTGVGTKFTTELQVGDEIIVSGETRTVTVITSDTALTVDQAFSNNANDTSVDRIPVALTVRGQDANANVVNVLDSTGASVLRINTGNVVSANNYLSFDGEGDFGNVQVNYAGQSSIRINNNYYYDNSWQGGTGGYAYSILPTAYSGAGASYSGLSITGSNTYTSGSGSVYNAALINPTLNVSGGATATYRGLYINPTLTGFSDYRGLQVDAVSSYATANNQQGAQITVTDTGVVTSGTDTTLGASINLTRTGATGGTINNTGLNVSLTGDGGGTSTNTGLNVSVTGADTNYAAIFQGGNVGIGDTSPAALLTVGASDAFQVDNSGNVNAAGTVTIGTLGTADTATYLCRNSSNIVAGCTVSPLSSSLTDNVTDALDIQEGTNNYINVNTTNGAENISFGNATTNPSYSFLGTGTLGVAGNATFGGTLAVTNGATTLTGPSGGSSTALTINQGAASNVGLSINGASSASANFLQVTGFGESYASFRVNNNGQTTVRPITGADGTVFQVNNAAGTTTPFYVDTSTGYTHTYGQIISGLVQHTGAYQMTIGGSNASFTTPQSATIGAKMVFDLYSPSTSGQVIALGLPSGADTSARGISLFDNRAAGDNQAVLSVFSPDETDVFGLSSDGSNSYGYLKATSGLGLGIKIGTTVAAQFETTGNTTLNYDLAVNGGDITSTGNLTVNATGYTRIGDTGTPSVATGDDDLYVESDIETGGTLTVGGTGTSTIAGPTIIGASGNYGIATLHMQSADNFSSGLRVRKRGNAGDINGAVASGAELGYHEFYGWNGSAYVRGAYVIARSTEAYTGSGNGSSYSIATTPNGTTTAVERLTIQQDGNVDATIAFRAPALDTASAGALTLGATNATSITIGKSGVTTTNAGALTITEALTANGNTTIGNANTDTLTINAGSSGSGITFGDSSFANCFLKTVSGALTCQSGTVLTNSLTDNVTDALDIQEGTNNYINVNTTNGAENISFGNATTNPSYSFLGSGTVTVSGLLTANGNFTLQAGDTFTLNGDGFTDFTGGGLVNNSGLLSVDDSSSIGFFKNGGNSYGAAAVLGTNDNNSLSLEVNNVTQATLAVGGAFTLQNSTDSTSGFKIMDADGGNPVLNIDTTNERVGIGTAFPNYNLHVVGNVPDANYAAGIGAVVTLGSNSHPQYIARFVGDISPSSGVGGSMTYIGQDVTLSSSSTNLGSDVTTIYGNSVDVSYTGSNTLHQLNGTSIADYLGGTASTSLLRGWWLDYGSVSSGTIDEAIGIETGSLANGGGGTINYGAGLRIGSVTTATNSVGAFIGQAGGTNYANLVLGTTSYPTGQFSIYNASTDDNYFAGNLSVGTSTNDAQLVVQNTATSENTLHLIAGHDNDTGTAYGVILDHIVNPSADTGGATFVGQEIATNIYPGAVIANDGVVGYSNHATYQSTGNLSELIGYTNNHDYFCATACGTIGFAADLVTHNALSGAGQPTVTKNVGISVEDKTGGTNNTNLLITTGSYNVVPAGNYSIYNQSTKDNVFAGNLRIGSTTAPTVALDVTGSAKVQTTTDSTTAFQVQNSSSYSLLTVDTSTQGSNIVTNGNFETNTTGWAQKGTATLTQVGTGTTQPYLGSGSMRVVTSAVNSGAAFTYVPSASTTYTLTMYIKASGSNSSTMVIGRQDVNGVNIDCLTNQTIVTTGWTKFTCTYTTGGTITAPSTIYAYDTTTTKTFYIDGVQVVTGSSPGSFNQGGQLALNGIINKPVALQNTSDSTNDFSIQNAAGANVFVADTLNGRISIGGSTVPQAKLEVIGDIISKGTEWTTRTSIADNSWNDVTYGNGIFVAVASSGTGNRVMTSTDGINWTARTSAADNNWQNVVYGNGIFVAVASSGTGNRVMTSTDGITWTARTSAADNTWTAIAYGNGIFVAVGQSGTGNRVMTSPDGINWTARTSANDLLWSDVTYGNGTFVAVAASGTGNRVMTSTDGVTWTARTSAADNDWSGVTYGNGLFVAVAVTGTGNRVMTSPNGTTWTSRTSSSDLSWVEVAYGNGLFVAVASSGTSVMTSTDGINWVTRASASSNSWTSIGYGAGMFVSVSNSGTGTRVMTSGRVDGTPFSANNIYQGGMTTYGNIVHKSDANSTTAFQIQNASSASLFTVDTTNNVLSLLDNNSGEPQTWATTQALPAARDNTNGGFIYNGYIYDPFGDNGTTAYANVAYAKVNADGTIGSTAWSTTGATSAPSRTYANAIQYNGYIYLLGGSTTTAGAASNATAYAKINADGTIGTWITGTNMPASRYNGAVAIANGYIYYMGGNSNTTASPTEQSGVYYAKINADGSLGSWSTATNSLTAARWGGRAVTVNNTIYFVGGAIGTGTSQVNVYYTRPDPSTGNTTGAWTSEATNTLPSARRNGALYYANNYLYYAAGNSGGVQPNVYYAQINANGSIGTWSTQNTANDIITSRETVGYASGNGYLYVMGGFNGTQLTTVEYVSLQRIKVNGALDLVGRSNGTLAEGGLGGELTAGNTKVVGSLDVQDAANFQRSVNIAGNLSVGNGDLYFGSGANRSIGVSVRPDAGTGYNLTLQAGAAGSGNNNGGNLVLAAASGSGTGVKGLVVIDTPTFTTASTQNCAAADCTITQANIDSNGAVIVSFTSTGLEAAMPDPNITTAGRIVYVTAANGSSDFTLCLNDVAANGTYDGTCNTTTGNSIAMRANTTATLVWNGSDWTAAGASSSTDLQAAYNNTLSSAGGAEVVLKNSSSSNGLTIRNGTGTDLITGALLETQSSIGSNLFSVNNNSTEFASNGGAETSGTSTCTSGFPASTWTTAPAGGTCSRSTTTVATGTASAQVVTTTSNHGLANTLSTTLTANLQYTVSFTIKSSVNFSTLEVVYSRDGTNTSTTACASAQTVTQSTWTRISCSFTAPSTGITSSNAIFIRQTDATGRTFNVDNLSVTVKASVNHAIDGSVDSALGTNWVAVGGTVTKVSSPVYDTSGSVSVAVSTTANRGVYNNLNAGIVPTQSSSGVQYRAAFYVKANTGTVTLNSTTPSVYYSPDSGTTKRACNDLNITSIATTDGWKLVSCIFTTDNTSPSGARFYITNTATTDFYVDALTITLNNNNANNVQIGGGSFGGPATLFTLDRSSGAPIADNNDAYLGSMYYDTSTGRIQCYEADGWGACGAAPDNYVNLNPEYAGAVLNGTGVGTMTADFCANQSGVLQVNYSASTDPCFTSGDVKNYYKWTSPQATQQTYSIYVTYQLPATFNGFSSDDTVQLVGRVDSTSNAAVTYQMYAKTSAGSLAQCWDSATSETAVTSSANTWQSVGINGNEATSCGLNSTYANGFIIFKINMKANSNASAYVSTLSFTTTGR